NLDGIYQEIVYLNQATAEGEALFSKKAPEERDRSRSKATKIDLSGFDPILDALGAAPRSEAAPRAAVMDPPTTDPPAPSAGGQAVHTLRFLMADYFGREGKNTGSDNRANIERAVKLFEDLCPQVRTLAAPDIPLAMWDELYEFVQIIPQMRGKAPPDDLVAFTRKLRTEGDKYPK